MAWFRPLPPATRVRPVANTVSPGLGHPFGGGDQVHVDAARYDDGLDDKILPNRGLLRGQYTPTDAPVVTYMEETSMARTHHFRRGCRCRRRTGDIAGPGLAGGGGDRDYDSERQRTRGQMHAERASDIVVCGRREEAKGVQGGVSAAGEGNCTRRLRSTGRMGWATWETITTPSSTGDWCLKWAQ